MPDIERIKQVVAYLDPDDYSLLHFLINATGVKQSPWIVGRYLILGLQVDLAKYGESLPNSDNERVTFDGLPPKIQDKLNLELIAFRHRQREQLQSTLNYLAMQTLDEDDLDRIQNLADELDLSLDEASTQADGPFASVVAYSNSNTAKGRCIKWLSEVFTKDEELPIRVVLAASSQQGFSETVTKQAKRALGLGHRKREGDGVWVWHSPILDLNPDNSDNPDNSTIHSSSSITLDREQLKSSVHEENS